MPDPQKILAIIRRAAVLSRATRGRNGSIVSLPPDAEDVLVAGDLHGQLMTFRRLLELADLPHHPHRHLVLQELIHGPYGYPDDGGDRSHQLVDVVAALKCQYPDRVHVILGNHELSELTGRVIGKNGVALNALFREGIDTAYGSRAEAVYASYQELFAALPLAVRTPNRVFLCHTIPEGYELDGFDPTISAQETWSSEAMKRHGAVYCVTWGRDTTPETADRFAGMVDADYFITGHQPCDEGFRQANHRQIIIDGTDPNPAYCLFRVTEPVTIDSLLAGARRLPQVD